MSYTTAEKNTAAWLLCNEFPNLHFGVARTWVSAEGGANDNVFGVTVGGVLQKYPTMEAGVKAAAERIKTLLVYHKLLAALEAPHLSNAPHFSKDHCPSYGAHANSQASAICRSPWNTGAAGLKKTGGVSLYYRRIFTSNGYTIE